MLEFDYKGSTAWYRAKTLELRQKRVEILFLEHRFCVTTSQIDPKHGLLFIRGIAPLIGIAKEFVEMNKPKND